MPGKNLVQYREQILKHFVCQESGNCCKASGYVYISHHEMIQMAKTLKISLHDFRKHFVTTINGWPLISSPSFRNQCFLNQDSKCTVYNNRPIACQTYPNWDAIWKDELTLQYEMDQCRGLNLAVTSFEQHV
mgnify:CR=1 FL=1